MPFPITSILDNGNRGDEGPPPSANWTTIDGQPVVDGNEFANTDALNPGSAYWNVGTFGPDCEVFATFTARQTDTGTNTLVLCYATDFSNAYILEIFRDDINGDQLKLSTLVNPDIWTQAINLQDGDSFGMRRAGSLIEIYHKPSGGSWTLQDTVTDSEISAAGYIGFGLNDTTARMDDFGGGDLIPTESTIIFRDSLRFTDINTYPMMPYTDTLTFTDQLVTVFDDTLTFTDALTVTMPDPVIFTDTLTFYEVYNVDGAPVTPPDDPATGGLGNVESAVLRLLYGNDKRNPVRYLDLADIAPGNIYLKQDSGFAPGSGELIELWTGESINNEGQELIAESRKNTTLAVKYVLKSTSQAALGYFQRKVRAFAEDAKRYNLGREGHKVWLEYRWADGLNTLPTPTFGQLSTYYEIKSIKAPKWPDNLYNLTQDLEQGVIDGVLLELTASPVAEGLKQACAIAGGAVSLHAKGVLVASGSSSKLHWPAYTGSGLTGQHSITLWFTLNAAWSSGTKDIFDYYVNGSNRERIQYDVDNTRFVITKIVGGSTFTANSSAFTISNGDDVHLIWVQDGTTVHLYVNGTQIASVAATATMTDGGLIALGCPGTGTVDGVDIIVDGARILPGALTSDQAAALYAAEKPIKDDGGYVGRPAVWLTKDADGMVDNYDDGSKDNWGLLFGGEGDVESMLSVYFDAGETINGKSLWLGVKAVDSSITPSDYFWFEGTGLKTNLERTILYGQYRRLSRLSMAASAAVSDGWSTFNTTNFFQKKTTTLTNTANRLIDFGDYFIKRDDTLDDTLAAFILFNTTSGTLTLAFNFLLSAPYVKLSPRTSLSNSQGIYVENGQAFLTDDPDAGARGDVVEYAGMPLTAVPNKYNYLFALQQLSTGDIDTTDTATVTVWVTPRYSTPGGMVA